MSEDSDIPLPRERGDFIGHAGAVAAFCEAEQSGRLHHAWLLGGPEGIGKATLAYRFARHLLASPAERIGSDDGLGVDPGGRTARLITALSHPNLIALERTAPEEGKPLPKFIGVDAIRKALGFFASTAADGGRRVCIVDAVDDLNIPAANALLKTIEEPPPGALILLVSHAPQRVLPTIRSRCRKLTMPALQPEELGRILTGLDPDGDPALRARAVAMGEGSVRRALTLLDPKRLALVDELSSLLRDLPNPSSAKVLAFANKLADKRNAEEFPIVVDTIQRWLSEEVERRLLGRAALLAPLAEVCENLTEAARTLEVYNLDRRAFIVSTFGDLTEAVRRAA